MTTLADVKAAVQSGDKTAMIALAQHLSEQQSTEAIIWLEKAISSGSAEAMLELGLWKMVGHLHSQNKQEGFNLFQQAWKHGNTRAGIMLSTAFASGSGVAASYPKAISYLIQTGKKGEATALRQLAFLLKPIPRFNKLRQTLYYQAAQQGDLTACYFLGKILCETGSEAQAMYGRGWLKIAADAGNWCAHTLLNKMEGEKLRSPKTIEEVKLPWIDLPRYLSLPHSRKYQKQEVLRNSPKIMEYKGILTSDETDYLISVGEPFLEPATVNDEIHGQIKDDTRSNSFTNFYFLESDVIIASINARIIGIAGTTNMNGDPLSLLHYQPGQAYAPHYDFFDPEYPAHIEPLKKHGQRTQTLLVYLNEEYDHGETDFSEIGFTYKGKKGDLLIFHNIDENGSVDRRTLHSGTAPTAGEKWLLSKWIRSLNNGSYE